MQPILHEPFVSRLISRTMSPKGQVLAGRAKFFKFEGINSIFCDSHRLRMPSSVPFKVALRGPCFLTTVEVQVLKERWRYPAARSRNMLLTIVYYVALGVYYIGLFNGFLIIPGHLNHAPPQKKI